MNLKYTLRFALPGILLIAVCLFSLSGVQAQADTKLLSTTPAPLVDVPFGDGWVASAPEDWLIWKPHDYPTADEASAALIQLFQIARPDLDVQPSTFTQFFDVTNFLIIRPELVDGKSVWLSSFTLLTKSGLVAGTTNSPDDVDAAFLAANLYSSSISDIIDLNGREALVTVSPTSDSVSYIVNIVSPSEDIILSNSISLPLSFMSIPEVDQTATALTMTIRKEGEPIDIDAWDKIMNGRWGDNAPCASS